MNAFKLAPLGLALIAGFSHFFVSVPVFEMGPDSLKQIIGAFNMSEGRGYTLENGNPVRSWPPLYASYASAFLSVNNSFSSLAVANSLLIAVISLSWSIFIITASNQFSIPPNNNARNIAIVDILLISSATFIIVHVLRTPSSDAVFAFTFPLYLLTAINLIYRPHKNSILVAYIFTSIALVNSHNMGAMLFMAASIFCFFLFLGRRNINKIISVLFTGIAASTSWLEVRRVFDLDGSHVFEGLFGADRPLWSAAFDLVSGPSDLLFFFWPIGALIITVVIFMSTMSVRYMTAGQRDVIFFLFGTFAIFNVLLFLMFTSITIYSGIGGRFALVQTLIILLLSAIVVRHLRPNAYILAIAIAVIPLASSGARVAKWYKEYHIDEVYQWNRSISLTRGILNIETMEKLRTSRCHESFCDARDGIKN